MKFAGDFDEIGLHGHDGVNVLMVAHRRARAAAAAVRGQREIITIGGKPE